MRRTKKQIQAQRRNEILFQLAGMLTTLKRFQHCYLANSKEQIESNRGSYITTEKLIIRGKLNVAIQSLEDVQKHVSGLTKIANWHNIFNEQDYGSKSRY